MLLDGEKARGGSDLGTSGRACTKPFYEPNNDKTAVALRIVTSNPNTWMKKVRVEALFRRDESNRDWRRWRGRQKMPIFKIGGTRLTSSKICTSKKKNEANGIEKQHKKKEEGGEEEAQRGEGRRQWIYSNWWIYWPTKTRDSARVLFECDTINVNEDDIQKEGFDMAAERYFSLFFLFSHLFFSVYSRCRMKISWFLPIIVKQDNLRGE